MRIIHDADTVEFTDSVGDKLLLLAAPRQKDVLACDEIARQDAFKQLENLRAAGFDPTELAAEAESAPAEEIEAARSAIAAGPAVRLFRLRALAVRMVVGSDTLGGPAVIDAYQSMDPASVIWVDEQVASVWESALLTDADARG